MFIQEFVTVVLQEDKNFLQVQLGLKIAQPNENSAKMMINE